MEQLQAAVRDGGAAVATGVAGSGKTTLCRMLADASDGHTFTAVIASPIASSEHLFARLLEGFGLIAKDSATVDRFPAVEAMAGALDRFLRGLSAIKASAMLIVVDAQSLPTSVLEEIARLAAIEARGERLLQIVLVGTPALLEVLQEPELAALDGRIAFRGRLEASWPDADIGETFWFQRRVPASAALAAVLLAVVLSVGISTLVYQRLAF